MTPPTGTQFSHMDVFVLRTPLLPFDEFSRWSESAKEHDGVGGETESSPPLHHTSALLQMRLADLVRRPEIREALFAASPDLHDALDLLSGDLGSKQAYRAVLSVVRYFARMSSRATPFGLFAGCAAGHVAHTTALNVCALTEVRRRARVNTQVLTALIADLWRDDRFRRECRLAQNSTLYRLGPSIRYYAKTLSAEGEFDNEVVSITRTSTLDLLLDASAHACVNFDVLVDVLGQQGVPSNDAQRFVGQLVDRQVFVPDLDLTVTCDDPLRDLADQLAQVPCTKDLASSLGTLAGEIDALNSEPIGIPLERYAHVMTRLPATAVSNDPQRSLHVEMSKSETVPVLGSSVVAEIVKGVNALHFAEEPEKDRLAWFVEAFQERYGEQEIPLAVVMDEESGLGFTEATGSFRQSSDLLTGLPFPKAQAVGGTMSIRDALLLSALTETLRSGKFEMELDIDALASATANQRSQLPNFVEVLGALIAPSAAAVQSGDFRVYIHGVFGPTPARLSARFALGDARIRDLVSHTIELEERSRPDAIFAEIVHLADPRPANIVLKPVLRQYEIAVIGRSGAPADRVISIGDIVVTVAHGRVILRSLRLSREVVPRLTAMHVARDRHVGLYRFLIAVGNQGGRAKLVWDWGPFRGESFLPRVTAGRAILNPARWRVPSREIRVIAAYRSPEERFEQMQRIRRRLALPRWVAFAEGDNLLTVDLDNVLSVEAFLPLARNAEYMLLFELLPAPSELVAAGPDGKYTHEFIVPLRRTAPAPAPTVRPHDTKPPFVRRHFGPGSDWLTLKVYGGPVTCNRVLLDSICPVIDQLERRGVVAHWYFVRYRDPEYHIRVRLLGPGDVLHRVVLDELEPLISRHLEEGILHRSQLDTYTREVERYGGSAAIELAEQLFAADSAAAIQLLRHSAWPAPKLWQIALRGIQTMLHDFDLDLDEQLAVMRRTRGQFRGGLFEDAPFRRAIAQRYRERIREVNASLSPLTPDTPFGQVSAILDARSVRVRPIAAELRRLETAGLLCRPLADVLASAIHMSVNRIFVAGANDHEPVIYDFLLRSIESRIARLRADARAPVGTDLARA